MNTSPSTPKAWGASCPYPMEIGDEGPIIELVTKSCKARKQPFKVYGGDNFKDENGYTYSYIAFGTIVYLLKMRGYKVVKDE
jgi:hypothetical protein